MSNKYKLFQYCSVQEKVVPIEEIKREKWAIDLYIQDDMEPTRNPLNPREIYTSKSQLRAAYRAAGAIEVGDAYDRGYIPERESGAPERRLVNQIKNRIIERYKNGR